MVTPLRFSCCHNSSIVATPWFATPKWESHVAVDATLVNNCQIWQLKWSFCEGKTIQTHLQQQDGEFQLIAFAEANQDLEDESRMEQCWEQMQDEHGFEQWTNFTSVSGSLSESEGTLQATKALTLDPKADACKDICCVAQWQVGHSSNPSSSVFHANKRFLAFDCVCPFNAL